MGEDDGLEETLRDFCLYTDFFYHVRLCICEMRARTFFDVRPSFQTPCLRIVV